MTSAAEITERIQRMRHNLLAGGLRATDLEIDAVSYTILINDLHNFHQFDSVEQAPTRLFDLDVSICASIPDAPPIVRVFSSTRSSSGGEIRVAAPDTSWQSGGRLLQRRRDEAVASKRLQVLGLSREFFPVDEIGEIKVVPIPDGLPIAPRGRGRLVDL